MLLIANVVSYIVVFFIAIVTLAWIFAKIYASPTKTSNTKTPADLDMHYEEVSFWSHGVEIKGWFIPSDSFSSGSTATIILNHQWSRNSERMLPFAALLHAARFNLLLYDSRSHGDSGVDGCSTINKFAEDLVSVVDYLHSRSDINPARIGVLGHSMGAASAILANSRDPRIKALVSDSAFSDTVDITRRALRRYHIPQWPFLWLVCKFWEREMGRKMREVSPKNNIGKIFNPILLIHGENDRLIPQENLQILYENSNKPLTQTWLVRDRGHSDTYLDENYACRIVSFFEENLINLGVHEDEIFAEIQ
ncbi:alpha/beta fold hydrolase [candidate division KSB1 bacterium]|nr:alpha/beta fold hydrolase [candidate division KSB1 bacterium]NIR69340.1 alpha/beta fold hydrolase [candidate division KSB1 bacterium]NIS24158.1 alpha/beta fold hydrolase [candidate division KSB1 bacterium]NIT71073.1 alpha/beta fold hydrolase [candidate division KSB1 bacterium]NIU24777.1 alpha/beta fold hydrolase [candidate division KSB1 bacterium]